MRIRFLLGPAGSGKTYRCLAEIREALLGAPAGAPLLLVAPKHTTYQLERRLLSEPTLEGYTRLQILSFERLAWFTFDWLEQPSPNMLDEEGRLMVLRGLLARKRDDLKLFRASARLTGFAQQLSLVLRDLQRNQLTPDSLRALAAQMSQSEGLSFKLQDLAVLLAEYLNWLKGHDLLDTDSVLAAATEALMTRAAIGKSLFNASGVSGAAGGGLIHSIWVDGFAEFSQQELDFLAALVLHCQQAAISLCLDPEATGQSSWLSPWSGIRRTFENCRKRLALLPGAELAVETLPREAGKNRFCGKSVLQHLERFWATPQPYRSEEGSIETPGLSLVACPDPEVEVIHAAREVLRFVRGGGRYREVMVLVRQLEPYYQSFQRIFSRYEIPFFLDRRESVAHHPLAELTRSALRTVAFHWQREDWFAALKTGLAPAREEEIDRLENEALARGWQGTIWQKPVHIPEDPALSQWLARLQTQLVPPFQRLALGMALCDTKPTGPQLAQALRELWRSLKIEARLEDWTANDASGARFRLPGSVHTTVWDQMNAWLDNVELAFPGEALSLREWLPILEAGLANLTVGLIPPALDQVLIGAVDRSRNPDVRLALVLGMNETLFPCHTTAGGLLTESDRHELERSNVLLGATSRQHLAAEWYHAYIAFTRPRERLVITWASCDSRGAPLNPSPFLSRIRQLFPSIKLDTVRQTLDWHEAEHVVELIPSFLKIESLASENRQEADVEPPAGPNSLVELPEVASMLREMGHFQNPKAGEALDPELATRLYGPALRTSVSRLEQFAACPFRFFVHSGLRAQERQLFELDVREQGSFQHDVLALFHEQLRREGRRWRDISPAEARQRLGQAAKGLTASYRDGLLESNEKTRFMARLLTETLQDFVETLTGWMAGQYQFDPVEVELPFGSKGEAPPWVVPLDSGRRLELRGRIDRIDLWRIPGGNEALCVVVDYKSNHKQLDPVFVEHGLQLQLLGYLNVLRHWPDPLTTFGAARLVPAGVFYVNLRGKREAEENRTEALAAPEQARKLAYRHTGRFDTRALPQLDARPGAREGDQLNYKRNNQGGIYRSSREAMDSAAFQALLDSVETNLKEMGRRIYAGDVAIDPYRKNSTTACDQCSYQSVCRIDRWTHHFRVLRKTNATASASPT